MGRFPGRAAAEHHALVLVSGGIDCRLAPQIEGGLALMVPPEHAWRARFELARYAEENRQQGRPALPLRPLAAGLEGVLVYCAVLFFLYGAPRRHAFSWDWWAAGTAQAGLITDGEWWRTVTALGLHADVGHLASNLFFGSVLGLLLAQALGSGFAWLAILLAGGLQCPGRAVAARDPRRRGRPPRRCSERWVFSRRSPGSVRLPSGAFGFVDGCPLRRA